MAVRATNFNNILQLLPLPSLVLLIIGAIALTSSTILESSALALVGLGLIFWGLIFLYIRKDEYVKKEVFELSISSTMVSLNQMIPEAGYKGKAVYLPPKYFKSPQTQKIYISIQKSSDLPTPEQLQQNESKMSFGSSLGMLLTPPGLDLFNFFEKKLETNLITADLRYLIDNFPKLFVEKLEIAKNFEMMINGDNIQVKMKNSIFKSSSKDVSGQSSGSSILFSPISSALAIAIVKVTSKPISIENEYITNGDTLIVEYSFVKEKG
jgi:hypothetical protein